MNILKLKTLIENISDSAEQQSQQKEWTTEEKRAALEKIGEYNKFGAQLRREYSLVEIAHTLAKITEAAERFAMKEVTEGSDKHWFDEHTIKENFKRLRKISEDFNKLSLEAHRLQQRMEALYDDGGHVLERYFEIKDLNEGSAPAVPKIVNQ